MVSVVVDKTGAVIEVMIKKHKISSGTMSRLKNNKDISTLNPFWLGQKEKRLFACFCSHKITHLFIQFQKECCSRIFHCKKEV
jgi:hypothetical protein